MDEAWRLRQEILALKRKIATLEAENKKLKEIINGRSSKREP